MNLCNQTNSVEINNFLHWLHQQKAQLAGFLSYHGPIDFDILSWARDISLATSDPVTDHPRPKQVRNYVESSSIPDEKRRTRAATTVDFRVGLLVICRDFNLVLHNASRR